MQQPYGISFLVSADLERDQQILNELMFDINRHMAWSIEWSMGLCDPLDVLVWEVANVACFIVEAEKKASRPYWQQFVEDYWMPQWSAARHEVGHWIGNAIMGPYCGCEDWE